MKYVKTVFCPYVNNVFLTYYILHIPNILGAQESYYYFSNYFGICSLLMLHWEFAQEKQTILRYDMQSTQGVTNNKPSQVENNEYFNAF